MLILQSCITRRDHSDACRSAIEINLMFSTPVLYQREDCSAGWHIKDWETANKLLSYLNTNGRSYAIFSKPDGSYVQCAGSKTRLTVETRIFKSQKEYRHYVFGNGSLQNLKDSVMTTEYKVTVDKSQVLQLSDARLIMKPWLEGGDFPTKYTLTDVTERFNEEPFAAST
jgi:hypothetical protein